MRRAFGEHSEGMSLDFVCLTPSSASALSTIDHASLQLRRVADRLTDAAVAVRRLAASTDWQTPAARAFFALAEHLAEEVVALAPLADAVRVEIALARARVVMQDTWDCR